MRDFGNVQAKADQLKEQGIKQVTAEESALSKKMEKQYKKSAEDLATSAEEINTRIQERAADAVNVAAGMKETINSSKAKAEGERPDFIPHLRTLTFGKP